MGMWTRKTNFKQDEGVGTVLKLKRSLTATDLVLLGIGGIIGAGLFSMTGIAAAENAGPAIVISFLIAAIGCSFAGLCYSELAGMIPVSGSAYTYTFASLGEFPAWLVGWTLILEYAIGAATVCISWSAYFVSLLHDMGIDLPVQWIASPWQSVTLRDGTVGHGIVNVPAFGIIALLSILLIYGIKESVKVNALIVILKIAIVVLFIGVGAFYINADNYVPFIPENTGKFGEFGWSGVFRAAGVIFFAYIGFDSVSTAAQESKNPQRTIPIGILGSLVICTILYILFAAVLTGLVPYPELNSAAPVAIAMAKTPFGWLSWIVKLAILAGFTSVILVMLLGQSRIFYVMACDNLLPNWFAALHPRWHTPWLSNIALLFFVGILGALVPLSIVGHMTSIGTLFAFVVVCLAVIILRNKDPHMKRPFRVPFYPLTPILGILSCILMMISLGEENWIRFAVWMLLGVAIYFIRYAKISEAK